MKNEILHGTLGWTSINTHNWAELFRELKIRNVLFGFGLFIILEAGLYRFANFIITNTVLFCGTSPLFYVLLPHILGNPLFN